MEQEMQTSSMKCGLIHHTATREEYLMEILHIMHVYCVGITACYSYSFEIVISKVVLVCFVHYFAFLSVTCINM